MEQTTGFVIGLKPEIRVAMENLVNAGVDWRIALLQLTLWVEPIFVDLPDEQDEQESEPEQVEQTEQISQN